MNELYSEADYQAVTMQLRKRFLILALVIITRIVSGVHWITDIIGGILFGDMLIAWYRAVLTRAAEKK